jgi:thiamine-phosphate pyrophosphorylase
VTDGRTSGSRRDRSGPSLGERLRLLVVTEPEPSSGMPLPQVVEACLRGGATAIELRHEGAAGGILLEEAERIGELARRHGALFLVNDRADVALAAGADGVHLGPDDPPVEAVRHFVPGGFIIGYSTDEPRAAREAAAAGADYLGVGAVYGTASKAGLENEAIGPERVGRVLRAAGLPGVGIGGIRPENAAAVAEEGAGVAVLGALMGAARPEDVARALRAAVDEAWARTGALTHPG